MARISKSKIKQDLIDQLQDMKVTGQHFYDLIDDYMRFWEIKNNLIKDIKKRGVSVEYNNGGGQKGYKKNDSISELNKISAQMLKILQQLNITTKEEVVDDEFEEL